MYRHYLDPTEPFVNAVIKPAHGAVITSATLRDSPGGPDRRQRRGRDAGRLEVAETRTGTRHLLAAIAPPWPRVRLRRRHQVLIVKT
jgi:ATP-dependent DNA helicase DinG